MCFSLKYIWACEMHIFAHIKEKCKGICSHSYIIGNVGKMDNVKPFKLKVTEQL
jgi:hypothetical protein